MLLDFCQPLQVAFLLLSVDLHPNRIGRPLLGGEEPALPDTEYGVEPNLFLEERHVDIGRQALIDLFNGLPQLIIPLPHQHLGYLAPYLQHIVPE